MGFAECTFVMESRTGSVSSGLGSSTGTKGKNLKSSPFCPHTSSKMAQSIIRDHMVSHYRKVYSARAVIDTSVPKSMLRSVKYNDQIREDWSRKGGRPQSAHSLSQRNSRASNYSAQSRLSMQYDDNPYISSRSSVVSTPRFSTSFHAKDIVYQSSKLDHSQRTRPASELRSTGSALPRNQSACSLAISRSQSCLKSFQDPAQKTYSGDLLKKHAQHFTEDKPFTPKTLKSDKSSYLAKYRYYRAPRMNDLQGCTNSNSQLMQQENNHKITKAKEDTQGIDEQSQGFITDHEESDDELKSTHLLVARPKSRLNKSKENGHFDSFSRVSLGIGKSPIMKKISAEEEELMYLEFISAVTEDILSRGHLSGRILDWVMNRHIDMNRHQLDEGKMRHLLVLLRQDFEEPVDEELEKRDKGLLDSLLSNLKSGGKDETKEDNDIFPSASLIKYCDSPSYTDASSVATPVCSPERTASPTKANEKDLESDYEEKSIGSPRLSRSLTDNTGISEEDLQHNQKDTTENHEHTSITSDESSHGDQAIVSHHGESKELGDLERRLSESLHVSSKVSLSGDCE